MLLDIKKAKQASSPKINYRAERILLLFKIIPSIQQNFKSIKENVGKIANLMFERQRNLEYENN